jgi:hypothetical protein
MSEEFEKRRVEITKLADEALADKLASAIDTAASVPAFVASFCDKANLLSQWRGYANGGGYSIEFDPQVLQGALQQAKFDSARGIFRVVYKESEQRDLVQFVLSRLVDSVPKAIARFRGDLNECAEELGAALFGQLAMLGPLFKDESFHEESEWRLVVWQSNPDAWVLENFRSVHGRIVPYIIISFDSSDASIISRVTVGPNAENELASDGVRRLLARHGFAENVKVASTPFRGW